MRAFVFTSLVILLLPLFRVLQQALPTGGQPGPDALPVVEARSYFVPNEGQWTSPARYVRRGGATRLFVEDRGWLLASEVGARGAAVRMRFRGEGRLEVHPEGMLPGTLNFLLGGDSSRWRFAVARYASLRMRDVVPGIDVRLREHDGHPEYDLLCAPGSNLADAIIQVDGARGLRIERDGSLIVDTAVGPLRQPRPATWELAADGERRRVECDFVLLDHRTFGFDAPSWNRDNALLVDPGIVWSTMLGGTADEVAAAMSIDAQGLLTVAGSTATVLYPTTTGAYDVTHNGSADVFVTRMDPSKIGAAQLLYSTFIGGNARDTLAAISADASGVLTLVGGTESTDYPTTALAYDTTHNGSSDLFVTRFDPSQSGSAQLAYSTFVGGASDDAGLALTTTGGVVTVVGRAGLGFPTSTGAFDTTHNGSFDAFVCRLDPSKVGVAQLVYSTFLGGTRLDEARAVVEGASGITVTGQTGGGFPTSIGAYDDTHNFDVDVFVSRLDPSKLGTAQLVYSTYVGGSGVDCANALAMASTGEVTVTGTTLSSSFPTTLGAYDTSYNGGAFIAGDVFVCRLDPTKLAAAQLTYSTFLGGQDGEVAAAIHLDAAGVATITGGTSSGDFPATLGAFDHTHNGSRDVFVSRLDPSKLGSAQLTYSTFLGGNSWDEGAAMAVDSSGVVTVAGRTTSSNFPTTPGSYQTAHNGGQDVFISRWPMTLALAADLVEVSIKLGGTQRLTLDAGSVHAGRLYLIAGSSSGTTPGIPLGPVSVPLNFDSYMNLTIALGNTPPFVGFKGTLDSSGRATASFVVPPTLLTITPFTLHHAYVVHGVGGNLFMASNPVSITLKN